MKIKINIIKTILLLLTILLVAITCKKEPKIPSITNKMFSPTVITSDITEITNNSALGGGNVTKNGNAIVTARGICWNTTGNPTLKNNTGYTSKGGGKGSFTSQMNSLIVGTAYYVVAYAINERGTAYGQEKLFITTNDLIDPRDGQAYQTIVIGNQTWLAENLNYQTTNSWWYDNSSVNGDIYGRLYTWDAAVTACPVGWHLPTDDEWKTLEIYLGMSQSEVNNDDWRGTDEGKKMKSTSSWISNGNGTNSSGFNALPGGSRTAGWGFSLLGNSSYWWSSSTSAWYRRLYYNNDKVNRYYSSRDDGFSVRCLKD